MDIKNSWITGFVDGDGCFFIGKPKVTFLSINKTLKPRHRFIISQDKRSVDTLYAIKKKLKCGSVHKAGGNMMAFQVGDKKSLETIIIPFFKKYPLQTEKRKDFYKFVDSFTQSNLEICEQYKNNFYDKKNKDFSFSINDEWFAGFIDADGCFTVSIVNNYPRPQLLLGVAETDKALLFSLQNYLGCGNIRVCKGKDNFVMFTVSSNKDFITKIFPKLYTKTGRNLLKTVKRISFQKFRKIVLLIEKKEHLTFLGLEKIVKLKSGINDYKVVSVNDAVLPTPKLLLPN